LRTIEFAKRYNQRNIIGVLHGEALKKEREKLMQEGSSHLQAYQPALNRVIEGLSEAQREECRAEAVRLNTSVWPKDLQRAWVQLNNFGMLLIIFSEAEQNTGRVCWDFIAEVSRKVGLKVFMMVAYEGETGVVTSQCVSLKSKDWICFLLSIHSFETQNNAKQFTEEHPEWKGEIWNMWADFNQNMPEGESHCPLIWPWNLTLQISRARGPVMDGCNNKPERISTLAQTTTWCLTSGVKKSASWLAEQGLLWVFWTDGTCNLEADVYSAYYTGFPSAPWGELGENPTKFIHPKYIPRSGSILDPSRLKKRDLDNIYHFWYLRQLAGKRPLKFLSDNRPTTKQSEIRLAKLKRKGKQAQYEELSDEEEEDEDEDEIGADMEDQETGDVEGSGSGPMVDTGSPAAHKDLPVAYLESLSNDPNYRACITLSKIVKVSVFSLDGGAFLMQS
jgi:hypothetical protein